MSIPMVTKSEIIKWAPRAKPEYVNSFLRLEEHLRAAGILDNKLSLCHFMAQCGGETDGLTIIRENLNYQSVTRIRQVWPARMRKYSDAWIKMNLVRNPVAIGQFCYGGRMGCDKAPSTDGYDFRGGSAFQTTGKEAVYRYCKALGIEPRSDILDNVEIGWRFAIFEWHHSGCQKYALANDILSVSRIINVGNAKSGVMPNGMENRKYWFRKAWTLWGDPARSTVPHVTDLTEEHLRQQGSETIQTTDLLKYGAGAGGVASAVTGAAQESGSIATVPVVPTQDIIDQLKMGTESVDTGAAFIASLKGFGVLLASNVWLLLLAFAIAVYLAARHVNRRRLADARMGLNVARVANQAPLPDAPPHDDPRYAPELAA